MKDKKTILSLDLEKEDLKQIKKQLEQNGWFFKFVKTGSQIRINVFLLEEDYTFFKEEPFYTVKGKNENEAFFMFLRDTKEKYELI